MIRKIGNYTIIEIGKFKQIYSPTRMLQVRGNRAWLIDLQSNKLLKEFKKVLKEIN